MTILKFLFSLLLICSFSDSYSQLNKYKIHTLGLPDDKLRNALKVVGDKWSITFESAGGCIFSKELEDSVLKLNNATYSLLSQKYGEDWKKRFDQEVKAEFDIEKIIHTYLSSQKFIKNKDLFNPYPGSFYRMYPSEKLNTYIVYIESWEKWKGNFENVIYYKLKVNYITKKIAFISTKPYIE